MTRDQAKSKALRGWNLRCNLCGEYPAQWIHGARPGWGDLALCDTHKAAFDAEVARHESAMSELRTINYEQDREE